MIEMLGVLAIVGILSAGGIAGYSMAMQNHKTNTLIEKIQLIAQQSRTLYNGDFSTLTRTNHMSELKNAGFITDDKNPFGGNITFEKSGWTDDNYAEICAQNIPSEACVKLLQVDWGSPGVFQGVAIFDTNGLNKSFRHKTGGWPPELSKVVSYCSGINKQICVSWK